MVKNELQEILDLARTNQTLAQWLVLFNKYHYNTVLDWEDSMTICIFCEAQEDYKGEVKHKRNCESKKIQEIVDALEAKE